jgi:hypothetical protein
MVELERGGEAGTTTLLFIQIENSQMFVGGTLAPRTRLFLGVSGVLLNGSI